jgi:hypothetical protein
MENLNHSFAKKTWITTTIILILITLMGGFLRIMYLSRSDFPLNDGGMFYTMIHDLQENSFGLPKYTTYNFSDIPYAYPPLSFYTVGAINQFAKVDLLELFRIYPLLFNLLSIPLFYFLAKELTSQNRFLSFIATSFYATLISSFEWLITGGGLTRSPAQTYFIAALVLYMIYLRTEKNRFYIFSLLTAVLMTYHHLEYTWFLFFSLVILVYQKKFLLRRYIILGLFFFLIILLTVPYWLSIVSQHGISPWVAAFTTGGFAISTSIGRIITTIFTEETISNYINILALLGIFFSLAAKKNQRIIIWLVAVTFLLNRSSFRSLVFPISLLAALGLGELVNTIRNILITRDSYPVERVDGSHSNSHTKSDLFIAIFVIFSILHPIIISLMVSLSEQQVLVALSKPEIEAMKWVKNNTPLDSWFIVLTPSNDWFTNRQSEWFPALASRKNVTTVQGTEWLPDSQNEREIIKYNQMRECLPEGFACLKKWIQENAVSFQYLFVTNVGSGRDKSAMMRNLLPAINTSNEYFLVYQNEEVIIFENK